MKLSIATLLCSLLALMPVYASHPGPVVAAASSLRTVWPALMQAYKPQHNPRITFGSSGNLSRQIRLGAPFQLFLSADSSHAQSVVDADLHSSDVKQIANGRLAWVAPAQSPLAAWLETGTKSPFPLGTIKRLAIANPRFAPYGVAASEVLTAINVSAIDSVAMAHAESVSQALQFALSGATDGGIVALSLFAATPENLPAGTVFHTIDSTQHRPLMLVMLLTSKADDETQALFRFLESAAAKKVFQQHGFTVGS